MKRAFFAVLFALWAGCGKVPTPIEPEETSGISGSPAQSHQAIPTVQNEPFNIETFGIDKLPLLSWQKAAIRKGVEKWEAVIIEGVPDVYAGIYKIDDVEITFSWGGHSDNNFVAYSGSIYERRDPPYFPCFGQITFYEDAKKHGTTREFWTAMTVHEIGHVLGFYRRMLERVGTKTTPDARYFTGAKACEAYRGFLYSQGEKMAYAIPDLRVPLMKDPTNNHWHDTALQWDVMTPHISSRVALTAVTIQAIADMGYIVDPSQAEIPSRYLTKPAVGPHFYCDGQHVSVVSDGGM